MSGACCAFGSHYLCGRKCRRQFLVVSMSHEVPSWLLWWLVVAVMYSESAPPSDVGVRGALSERLGDRTMDRSHRGSLCRCECACVLYDVPSMAVSDEATGVSAAVKSTLVPRVTLSQDWLHAP